MRATLAKLHRHGRRFLLLFAALMMAMLLWLLTGQVYLQAVASAQRIERESMTLAVERSPWQAEKHENGYAALVRQELDAARIGQALASPAVKQIHSSRSFAGWAAGVEPVVPKTHEALWRASGNYLNAENTAAFAVRVNTIEILPGSRGKIIDGQVQLLHYDVYLLDAEVTRVLSLNPGYAAPERIQVHGWLVEPDGSIPFKTGDEYIVIGRYEPAQPEMIVSGISKGSMDYAFRNAEGFHGLLRLEMDGYRGDENIWQDERGNWRLLESQQAAYPLYMPAGDERLPAMLELVRFNRELLWVTGVDDIRAIRLFAQGDAQVMDGRMLTVEECREGARICMISDTLAAANDLSVGQELCLSLHETDFFEDASLTGSHTKLQQIFPLPQRSEEITYTIAGIYHTVEWTEIRHGFSPNTVFVPQSSLPAGGAEGVAYADSVILHNGMQEQFLLDAEAAGLPADAFTIIEDGYSACMASLGAMRKDTAAAWTAAAFVNAIASVSAVYLVAVQLRKDAVIMRQVGASALHVQRYKLGCMLPVVLLSAAAAYGVCCMICPALIEAVSGWYTMAPPAFSNLTDTSDLLRTGIMPSPPLWSVGAAALPALGSALLLILTHAGGERS